MAGSAGIIGEIGISNDALGLGALGSGIVQARNNSVCGPKPICIGAFKNCKARQQAHMDCLNRNNANEAQAKMLANQPQEKSPMLTYVLIGVGLIALFLILRKNGKN